MVQCEVCGKQVDLPFRCNYCGGLFCAEHRLPESHQCLHSPKEPPEYLRERLPKTNQDEPRRQPLPLNKNVEYVSQGPLHFEKGGGWEKKRKEKTRKRNIAFACFLTAIIFVAIFFLFINPNILNQNNISTKNPITSPSAVPSFTTGSQATPNTDTYSDLVNYALSLINSDRQSNGLQNVSLSSIDSAQLHAENMLKNGYVSHWDMNGYKPYMRYTLAGGQGAVAENIAWQGETGNIVGINVESALKDMEYSMMYNDSASNWGHRDNILNPLHNEVSIGIAYDNNNVYFVEDFINDYISWNQLSVNSTEVTMQGTIQNQTSNIQQVDIFYDNPSPLSVNQLNNPPYQDGYDPGTYAAIVVPPASSGYYYNWSGVNVTGIVADNWNQNGNSFQISFSMSQAIAVYGNGVYTLYLEIGNSTADSLTTYSVWIN